MTTYNFDAFGNPVQTTASGKLPATVLYSDGVYDPALAAYYLPIRRHDATAGRFTSPACCKKTHPRPGGPGQNPNIGGAAVGREVSVDRLEWRNWLITRDFVLVFSGNPIGDCAGHGSQIGMGVRLRASGGVAMVILEHSAEPLSAENRPIARERVGGVLGEQE
jgi:hypothetical protein